MPGNEALLSNPVNSDIDITTNGSDWLWAVFCIMAATDIGFVFAALRAPLGQRAFFHMPIIILTTASIAYFSMASDLGATPIVVEYTKYWAGNGSTNFPTRAIWYVRYIDWTVTTPMLLLELLLGTGLPLSDIIVTIFFDLVMIITGLVGALVESQYKWGFFTFGCLALFYVWWILLGPARTSAARLGVEAGAAFRNSAAFLSFLWLLYPIAWGLADGANVIHPDSEMVFYGILDILAKPVFCIVHVLALRKIPYDTFHLSSGKLSDGYVNTPGRNEAQFGNNTATTTARADPHLTNNKTTATTTPAAPATTTL